MYYDVIHKIHYRNNDSYNKIFYTICVCMYKQVDTVAIRNTKVFIRVHTSAKAESRGLLLTKTYLKRHPIAMWRNLFPSTPGSGPIPTFRWANDFVSNPTQ